MNEFSCIRITRLSKHKVGGSNKPSVKSDRNVPPSKKRKLARQSFVVKAAKTAHVVCSQQHTFYKCAKLNEMTINVHFQVTKDARLYFNCSKGHSNTIAKGCTAETYKNCRHKHDILLRFKGTDKKITINKARQSSQSGFCFITKTSLPSL